MREGVSPAREAARYVLGRCRRFDAWSQQTLTKAAEKFSLDERDAALCARLCLSVLQNAGLCDYYINCVSSVPVEKLEPQILDILRLGACQILFMDRIPASAAVDQAVEQTKTCSRRAAPLVNAVLRRIAEMTDHLPEIPDPGTARELSIRYSHPLWLCEKLVREFGCDHARAFLACSNQESRLTVSANLNRIDPVSLTNTFQAAGFDARISMLSPISVELADAGAVTGIPGFKEGLFFVQDAASALSVVSANPQKGMRILDCCAAPGGKSLLCASLTKGECEILACDLHEKKLRLIEDNAARLSFDCIRTAQMDASDPYGRLLGGFDLVLADVPCSGMGVIRKKPEIRYKDPSSVSRLPEVQRRILAGASRCVKPGGALVYSTCTVFREENEQVTRSFLDANKDFSLEEMRTIWPQEFETDGFFFCRMRRNG